MNFEYVQWGSWLKWFSVSILIPVAGPLVVLWFFSMPRRTAALTKHIVIKSIGKGELFWVAMGMAAATCYDLDAFQKIATDPAWKGYAGWAYGAHLLIILFAAIMVGLSSLEPPTGFAPANPNIPDYFVFWASIATLLVVIGSYSFFHAALIGQEAKACKNAILQLREHFAEA